MEIKNSDHMGGGDPLYTFLIFSRVSKLASINNEASWRTIWKPRYYDYSFYKFFFFLNYKQVYYIFNYSFQWLFFFYSFSLFYFYRIYFIAFLWFSAVNYSGKGHLFERLCIWSKVNTHSYISYQKNTNIYNTI